MASTFRSRLPRAFAALGGLAVFIIGGTAYAMLTGDADLAEAGDCVAPDGANNVKVVDCGDPTAKFTVLGKEDKVVQAKLEAKETCSAFEGTESAFWKGVEGGNGYILCLGPKK
ncbi:LppU/SCO3897 family protein [Actinomadura flavalba]|uniref:LppU/SCO3897 family protein n=1 Tax=Actinomadura flavalba TaxID=1120938 RepID=UPI00035F098E|nr:hypothetical protein [Actinomadura flavalba]